MDQLFLGKLYFGLFLRKIGLGQLEGAQEYLAQAIHVAPMLAEQQEELLRLITSWIMGQVPETRPALVQRIADNLAGNLANSRQLGQRVLGRTHIAQAFAEYSDGRGGQTRDQILKGLRYDPSQLRNRGVIAIFAKSFLKQQNALTDNEHAPEEVLPPLNVSTEIEAILGCAVAKTKCMKGLSGNKIYRIEAGGQPYILRLLKQARVDQNAAVVKQLRAVGVPTPAVVASSSSTVTANSPSWLLEEWSSGSWFEPPTMSPADELRIVTELGRYLQGVHQIKAKGFGEISSAQLDAPYPILAAWLNERQQIIEEGCLAGIIPEPAVTSLAAAADLLRESFGGPATLCHGDLGRGNILVEAGQIKSIIDWGDAIGGDPAYDIAVFLASMSLYWDAPKISAILPAFLQAYGADGSAEFYRRIAAHQLLYIAYEVARLGGDDEAGYFKAYQSILADAGRGNQQTTIRQF